MQSVPYWVDDESVRSAMIASSEEPVPNLNKAEMQTAKPRLGLDKHEAATHPLLGDAPRLRLIRESPMPGALQWLLDVHVGNQYMAMSALQTSTSPVSWGARHLFCL